jgi:hypothetical protein
VLASSQQQKCTLCRAQDDKENIPNHRTAVQLFMNDPLPAENP